jgi:hypothetical protein
VNHINASFQVQLSNLEVLHNIVNYRINLRIFWFWIDDLKVSTINNKFIISYRHPVINKLVYEFLDKETDNSSCEKTHIENHYVYNTENYINLIGVKFKNFRRKINHFTKFHPINNITSQKLKHCENDLIISLYQKFSIDKDDNDLIEKERKALQKTLKYKSDLDTLVVFFLYIKDEIQGFSIVDYYNTTTAYIPFIKSNKNKRSSMYYFFQKICLELHKQKISKLNFEDDLNEIGIAQFKKTLGPSEIISNKCYII